MHTGQTDGAIAAEMLTATIQKMIYFLKTNRARPHSVSGPQITVHTTGSCCVDSGGSGAIAFHHEMCSTQEAAAKVSTGFM